MIAHIFSVAKETFYAYRLLELFRKLLWREGTRIAQIIQPQHGFYYNLEKIGYVT